MLHINSAHRAGFRLNVAKCLVPKHFFGHTLTFFPRDESKAVSPHRLVCALQHLWSFSHFADQLAAVMIRVTFHMCSRRSFTGYDESKRSPLKL